jgi:UDP-N-acetylmuramyl tripeptide synthase
VFFGQEVKYSTLTFLVNSTKGKTMITETLIKTFQKKNKQSDVMGVIRTLYPNVEISISKKKGKKNEVQN